MIIINVLDVIVVFDITIIIIIIIIITLQIRVYSGIDESWRRGRKR